jgi:hypothetical protein
MILPNSATNSLHPSWRESALRELRLMQEQRQRAIRSSFGLWCEHALAPLGHAPAAHHRLLIRELQAVADGECDRLMLFFPPGAAKSTYGSQLFPAWLLARRGINIIGAAHTADLAEHFSRHVIRLAQQHGAVLGYGLENESVGAWETTNGGEYKAAGVGGPISGRRGDVVLIDDPVKSREQADSEPYRDRNERTESISMLGAPATRLRRAVLRLAGLR